MKIPKSCGHVYVIQARGRVKVGRSRLPEKRLRTLSTQGGVRLERTYVTPLHEGCAQTEAAAHAALAEHRVIGEWFSTDFDTAVAAVERAYQARGELTEARAAELCAEEEDRAVRALQRLDAAFKSEPAKGKSRDQDVREARVAGSQLAFGAYRLVMEGGGEDQATGIALRQILGAIDGDTELGAICLHWFVAELLRLSVCDCSRDSQRS